MIQLTPSTVSHNFILLICLTTLRIESKKVSVLPSIPKSVCSCDAAIIIAAAFVKPQITGILTKSSIKPTWRIPIAVIIEPERKHRRTLG